MAQTSSIEWTESTWNPVAGCTKVSAGCQHCYAERMARRLAAVARAARGQGRNPGRAANYCGVVAADGRWNGKVHLDDSAINVPLRWKKPRFVFVNSMSDLFHEAVPFEFVERVFSTMNACPQHTFQVLTKRPHVAAAIAHRLRWTENIWIGTTVENALVTERIRHLGQIPAHVRFLSVEPLLGPIPRLALSKIDWVIVGGESGPGARKMQPGWVQQIKTRCVAQAVPFFFKQWGGVNKKQNGRLLDGKMWDELPTQADRSGRYPDEIRVAFS